LVLFGVQGGGGFASGDVGGVEIGIVAGSSGEVEIGASGKEGFEDRGGIEVAREEG
jgi:hypothetical protein